MVQNVSKQSIQRFQKRFLDCPTFRIAQNAVLRSDVSAVSLNADRFAQRNHHFSVVIPDEMKVTNQKRSGRCWLFAALNLLRIEMGRKFKLEQFEFSQNYPFFWDKFEKANYFFESIIQTAGEPFDSRIVAHLLRDPVQDGGQWHMFVNLVEKYGLVPQEAYPDSQACNDSKAINYVLTLKLREFAVQLRKLVAKGAKRSVLQKEKEQMLECIYRILCIHLGTPPTKFDWHYRTKEKKFLCEEGITPLAFMKKYNPLKLSEYVCPVHSPRRTTPLMKTYTVEYLGNVVEGHPVHYVNVTPQDMKEAVIKSLKAKEPVWFGCDVGKCFHRDLGVMDCSLYDWEPLYATEFGMDKATRMDYGESLMTHAMLFTGVHLSKGKPTKWRVENSWGKTVGEKGFFIMTDDWFDEYMFEVAVHPKYLSKKVLEANKQKPIVLPAWDPLGACAD